MEAYFCTKKVARQFNSETDQPVQETVPDIILVLVMMQHSYKFRAVLKKITKICMRKIRKWLQLNGKLRQRKDKAAIVLSKIKI
jgi:hypothetical protein